MNPQELQKNIALYYSKLSPKLQEVFSSMKWLEDLKIISAKYSLSEKQIQTLGTETTLVLLGMIHLDEYEGVLKKELMLPKESLDKMLLEINNSVLNTIRPDLTEAFETNTTPETKEEQEREDELDGRFAKLPIEVQDAIRDMNYHMTLYKIGTEHNLTVAQIVNLETVTTNVMLGIIKGEKFEEAVKSSLELADDKTKELVNEIKEKILNKIREKMKVVFNNKPEVPEDETNNTQILNSAGIEIVPEKLEISSANPPLLVEEGAGGGDSKDLPPRLSGTPPQKGGEETPHPILAQKLSGPVRSAVVETTHSLDNITKTNTPIMPSEKPKIPSADPYREIPE